MNRSRAGLTILEVLVTLAIISLLLAILLPAIQYARESARQTDCSNRLRQIGIGVHLFCDSYHKFPFPAFIGRPESEKGMEPISWRLRLLEFVEEKDLDREYRKNQAWDGAQNKELIAQMPALFGCPNGNPRTMGLADFESIPPFKDRRSNMYRRIDDMPSHSIIVNELSPLFIVPWTKPYNDLVMPFNQETQLYDPTQVLTNRAFRGNHGGTFHVLAADGHVDRLSELFDDEDRRYWKSEIEGHPLNRSERLQASLRRGSSQESEF